MKYVDSTKCDVINIHTHTHAHARNNRRVYVAVSVLHGLQIVAAGNSVNMSWYLRKWLVHVSSFVHI